MSNIYFLACKKINTGQGETLVVIGNLIVIEGTDGTGKETQAKLLIKRLEKEGYAAAYADFPQHGMQSCFFVDKYLRGKYGLLSEIGPYKASVLYAVDRFDKSFEMRSWLGDGKIVVCNRYATSNMGHQAGKIKNIHQVDEFLAWLNDLEYNKLGIPKQDRTILLFAPPEIGRKKVFEKNKRPYLEGEDADIHELDENHLRDAASAYLYVARKEGWSIIDCTEGGALLPPDIIHEKVYGVVKEMIGRYNQPGSGNEHSI
jgi:dTMP kinase